MILPCEKFDKQYKLLYINEIVLLKFSFDL